MSNLKLSDSFVVTLHNDLVQARFSDSLTLNEQKILYAVLSNIEPPEFLKNDEGVRVIKEPINEIKPFRVSIKDFTEWLGVKDPNYVAFKETIKKLMRKLIEIKQDNGSWDIFQWVTKSSYIADEGIAEINLSPELYPYLLNLENNFTTVKLDVLLGFKSVYSPRLYQLAKKWSKIGSWKVELDELKYLIGVPSTEGKNGEREFKLSRYNHFKTRALEVAINEINTLSELHLSFKENKKGRKITSLTFEIKKNKSKKVLPDTEKKEHDSSNSEKIYGKEFAKNYNWDSSLKSFVDKDNNAVKFDGSERAKAFIFYNGMEDMKVNALYKIEKIIVDIMEFKDYNVIQELNALFTYTKQAQSIVNNEAFIISKLRKVLEDLKIDKKTSMKDILNIKIEVIPEWFVEGLKSKKDSEFEYNEEEKERKREEISKLINS